tara:strand:- start:811 stop:1437 length:627 start_codon:yes stop_codon:yes gene_type:complete
MVLPSSGSLSYNTIRAEFGSPSSNVYLSLYYRGGPYTYNVPRNSSITTSTTGSIAVNDFYGAAGKGDYAAGPFGYYSSGGKFATLHGGCGGPNIPGMSDTSIRTNVFSTGFTKNFATNAGITPGTFTVGPFASGNNNQSRSYYYYNTSGGLIRAFTFKSNVPTGSNGDTQINSITDGPAPYTTDTVAGGNVWSAITWNLSGLHIIRAF